MPETHENNTPNLSLIEQLHTISSYVQGEGFSRLDKVETRQMQRLTQRQSHAIGVIFRYTRIWGHGMSMSALADALHMSASAVSHMVDALEEQELVEREPSAADHRSILVNVHPKRIPHAEAIEQGMQDAIDCLSEALTQEECATFARCIDQMYTRAVKHKKR